MPSDFPDKLLSVAEAEKLRERINADEAKSTETLSTISRTLATGLALIIYSFFVQKDQSEFVKSNFEMLRYASIFGVLALSADALQYAFASVQVRQLRSSIKAHIKQHLSLGLRDLDFFTRNAFYILRDIMFWLKLFFVAIGTATVVVVIVQAKAP